MRSVHVHDSVADRPISTTRRRATPVQVCAAALGLLTVVLAARVTALRMSSQETRSLSTIGITPVAPPKPVPALVFVDESGRPLRLVDFRGRAVVLNFWATWCVPCRQEMPSLDRLQAKLGGADFQVLAVSIDKQGAAVVQPFYRELGLRSLGIMLDTSDRAPVALGVEGLPTTLLINPQDQEIGRKLGALAWDRAAVINALRNTLGLAERSQ